MLHEQREQLMRVIAVHAKLPAALEASSSESESGGGGGAKGSEQLAKMRTTLERIEELIHNVAVYVLRSTFYVLIRLVVVVVVVAVVSHPFAAGDDDSSSSSSAVSGKFF